MKGLTIQNILPDQTLLINELQMNDPTLVIEWDEVRGVAAFIRGILAQPPETTPENLIQSFLRKVGGLFGVSDPNSRLELLRSRTDELGWMHLEFQQMYYKSERPNDVFEVYGSKLAAHFTADGMLSEIQSSCWREIKLNLEEPISIKQLRKLLTKRAVKAPNFRELQVHLEQHEENFPIMQIPRLVIYPWQEGFRLAWTTYAYGVGDTRDSSGKPTGNKALQLGQVFVDALTGEQFIFAPTRMHLEIPDSGSGLGVTPLKGPFSIRTLNIVRIDSTSTYRLRDTTHQGPDPRQGRDIITFDTEGAKYTDIPYELSKDTVPVSEDIDGDKNWSRIAADTTDNERTKSQQPEVDAHYLCGKIYEWYYALGKGRAGWDNNQYDATIVPYQPVRALIHAYDNDTVKTRSPNSYYNKGLSSGRWYAYLLFCDGDPTQKCTTSGTDTGFGYFSGSDFIVAHEYQHAITDFSFIDGSGAPGLTPDGWLAAVHEGLSDVFGCFFSKNWTPGPDFTYNGVVFRNLAYPRDSLSWCNRIGPDSCGFANSNRDHFDDRNSTSTHAHKYDRGTILAHCAYLMGQGGIHQRDIRKPILIPVYGLGSEFRYGINILKAARIWYHALTYYFSTHGVLTDNPKNDENSFRILRNACESAVKSIYKANSNEHRTTVLAFYAVGLLSGPSTSPTSYGPDVTFLRWGTDWCMSRQYIGIHSPDWSSVDLFINNGGISEWNAKINLIDVTKFENTVYCRVRNIGDIDAKNIQVEFFYAKAGTGVTTWLPVKDSRGNIQRLTVGTLGAGQSNFPDSDQNSPPIFASVKWYIPPLAAGEAVNHFCIKAIASCTNDVNKYNDQVQSNIIYAPYVPEGLKIAFTAGNPKMETIPLELHVDATIPKGWNASIQEPNSQVSLEPGEERTFHISIDMPEQADQHLELPLDGELVGQIFGSISGPITGTITEATIEGDYMRGRFSARLGDIGTLEGSIDGSLNISTGQINGNVTGIYYSTIEINAKSKSISFGVEACLRPFRRVNISQTINGEPIGGITIQIQMLIRSGPCTQELPPTDPFVNQ